ncbi:unnamed protein product [Clonostachys rosea f. rosea IK726]|uniref:Aquaporin n=2 Tax=Bionectria ochroleuca TaxID=29856 RepID=A0A0B7K3Y8_BIOOC|nr:unnamed protein product [Clonostachys rosea f. rosea IK726]
MSGESDAYRADGMLFSVWAGHCHTSLVIGAEPLCIILEHMVQKLDGEQRANRAGQRLRYEMSWLPRINLTPQRLYDIDGITIDRPLGEEGCTKDFVDSSSEVSSAVFTSEPLSEPDHVEEASVLQECNSLKTGESQHAPTDPRNSWAKLRAIHREAFSEFLATGVAVFLGLSGTLTVSLSLDSPVHYGTYETSCWSWGFAWMFGIYLGGGVSGAHMNPAISISLSLFRGFPWNRCAIYVAAQFLAGLAAGGLAYGLFADSLHHIDPELTSVSASFFSTPQPWVSRGSAILNQVVASAIMSMAVLSLGDDRNNPPAHGMSAFIFGLLVTTLKLTLGYNVGAALNPASDFGPRVIAYAIGYRDQETFGTHWWYQGPWLGTLAGAIMGCIIYDGLIFIGGESPINRHLSGSLQKTLRKLFRLPKNTANKGGENKEEA